MTLEGHGCPSSPCRSVFLPWRASKQKAAPKGVKLGRSTQKWCAKSKAPDTAYVMAVSDKGGRGGTFVIRIRKDCRHCGNNNECYYCCGWRKHGQRQEHSPVAKN